MDQPQNSTKTPSKESKKSKRTQKKSLNNQPTYPWEEYKEAFFKSPHVGVRDFFREVLPDKEDIEKFFISKNFREKTEGWGAEKRAMKRRAMVEAIKEFEEEYKDILKDSYRFAIKQIHKDLREGKIPAKHLKAYWEMVRTEMGLVTRIVKQENTPADLDDLDMAQLLDTIRENAQPNRKSDQSVEAPSEKRSVDGIQGHEALGEAPTPGAT